MYLVHYIGAIAILFLFIIMIIDIEVVEKRSNNYLPLLFLFLSGFLFSLKKIIENMGLIKMKSLLHKEEKMIITESKLELYSLLEPVLIDKIKYTNYNNNSSFKNNDDKGKGNYKNGHESNYPDNRYSQFDNVNTENENGNIQSNNFHVINSNSNDNGYFLQRIRNE